MYLDVVDLRAFYYRTKLGRSAQRALQEALRRVWPETRALTVVGFGFAAPMLRPFLSDARRVVALMPAQQGVMPWPPGGPNVSTLVEETRWPVSAGSIDRVIVAPGLAPCAAPGALLAALAPTYLALLPAAVLICSITSGLGALTSSYKVAGDCTLASSRWACRPSWAIRMAKRTASRDKSVPSMGTRMCMRIPFNNRLPRCGNPAKSIYLWQQTTGCPWPRVGGFVAASLDAGQDLPAPERAQCRGLASGRVR